MISKAQIPIRVVLGNSSVSVNDFAMLQEGDIIRLDSKVNQELKVFVGNIQKFDALPGTSGNKYAVRVTDIIKEDEEDE